MILLDSIRLDSIIGSQLCLCFGSQKPVLVGYTDADMAGDVDKRKSTSGYLVTFSGGAVAWQSKLQKSVALSTEFMAITEADADEEILIRVQAREISTAL